MNTGLRRGELLNFAWADISFSGRYLTASARNAKSKEGRIVPLNNEVFSTLESWRQQNLDSLYIYEGKIGLPLSANLFLPEGELQRVLYSWK
jgi:integrase